LLTPRYSPYICICWNKWQAKWIYC